MIIWLDGTYGIGKSAIAAELENKCEDCVVLESDVLWKESNKEIFEEAEKNNGFPGVWSLPQNDIRFLQYFRKRIMGEASKHLFVIVDMALTRPESRDYLYVPVEETPKNSVHIILDANEAEIHQRILQDENRNKKVAIDYLRENLDFLKNNYADAWRIDTSGRSVEDIAEEILRIIYDKL